MSCRPTVFSCPLLLLLWVVLFSSLSSLVVQGFVPQSIREQWKTDGYSIDDALRQIEASAIKRQEEDYDLYYATRFIDRNAHKLYSEQDKLDMWNKAKGSWELRLAYEDSRRDLYFFPYPDFRDFAMAYINIEDHYFGKGIARNSEFSFVAMGGPSKVISEKRQLYMDYQDFYLNGNLLPDWDLSYFMRGYARNWYAMERNRPPLAFTIIAVTDKILVVRGSKTGGMAVFMRIQKDMTEASYGRDEAWDEDTRDLWKNIPGRKRRKELAEARRKAQKKIGDNDSDGAKPKGSGGDDDDPKPKALESSSRRNVRMLGWVLGGMQQQQQRA